MNPILESIKPVVSSSKHVKVNISKIKELAKKLSDFDFPVQEYDFYPKINSDGIRQFTFILNSINFQYNEFEPPFTKFEVDYKGQKCGGFFSLAYSLRMAIEEGVPVLDAKYLSNISEKDALKFLKKNITIPMLDERIKILREVGSVLTKKYNGQFSNFLKLSNRAFDSGRGLVERLTIIFPSFNDVRIYKPTNTIVKFYKRAQLLLASLHYNPDSDFKLKDIGELTIFVDYRIPGALRDLKILEYSKELAKKIDNFVMIPEGSDEEVEIRANAIHASDLLCKEINKYRKNKIIPVNIDEYLWLEGKKSKKPRHFTRTIFY